MALCTTSYCEPYTQLLFAITQMARTIPTGVLPITTQHIVFPNLALHRNPLRSVHLRNVIQP